MGAAVLVKAVGCGCFLVIGVVLRHGGEGGDRIGDGLSEISGVRKIDGRQLGVNVGSGGQWGERASSGDAVVDFEGGQVTKRTVGSGVTCEANSGRQLWPSLVLVFWEDAHAAIPVPPENLHQRVSGS